MSELAQQQKAAQGMMESLYNSLIELKETQDADRSKTEKAMAEGNDEIYEELRKMRKDIEEVQAKDRQQINDGFQQLRESMQSSVQTLDEKVNEYIDEVNGRLKAFASLVAEANDATFEKKQAQNQRLFEIIESTNVHNKEFKHLDTGLKTFSNFQIRTPANAGRSVVTKSDLIGGKQGTYFEFPQLTKGPQNSLHIPREFQQRVIQKISACVGVGLYSIQLTYNDGSVSPVIGKRDLNAEADILPGEISSIAVQHFKDNYVQTMTVLDPNKNILAQVECPGAKGEVDECQIGSAQKVIGIYGYQDSKQDIRGIGFILTEQVQD